MSGMRKDGNDKKERKEEKEREKRREGGEKEGEGEKSSFTEPGKNSSAGMRGIRQLSALVLFPRV